eukprot:g29120.t1
MSMTSPGYFVEELTTGKLFHTADIIQVEDMPEGVELPDREAGLIHEVDVREEVEEPRKRPGRTRGKAKLPQLETDTEVVDWGELDHRGAQLLSRELQLLEEENGEIQNEKFLKALTLEIEDLGQEAVRMNRQEQQEASEELRKTMEDAPEFLQTRMEALYGLVTSPKDWCTHRDRHIKEFQWEGDGRCYRVEKTMQDDMWAIRSRGMGEEEWSLVGLCATYVDDIIITGSVEVVKGIHQKIQESWKIGAPSWVEDGGEPVRFLGMEIEKKGGNFVIHQRAYLENLFLEYEESGKANLNQVKMPEVEENIEMSEVTRAQKETGELLWVAGRTRPDISLAVNTMCEWATKRPKGVIDIGRQVRAYLRETRDESLVIRGAEEEAGSQEDWKTVKVFSDASYASSGFKSITGVVGCLGGTPITWQTSRQAFVTLSTAEAELMAFLEGLITARWEVKNEEVLDFLRDLNFQPGFLTEKLRRRVGIPPRRTSAKDDWHLLEDHQHGKKITVREHMQDRKKMFDFENAKLWDQDEWSPWRMTIAWQVIGSTLGKTKLIVVDQRSGRKSEYLPFSWVGYTLFKTS